MTHDTGGGGGGGGDILSKFQLPYSYGLGVMAFLRFGGIGSLNE